MKPSDFPRDSQFCTPGPAIVEDGVVHLRRHRDIERALLDSDELEFSPDVSFWATESRRNLITHFFWTTGRRQADGGPGRHDALRAIVEPYFRHRAVKALTPMIRAHALDLVRDIVASGQGEFDLAHQLAYPLALRTIMSMVGMPREREDWVHELTWPTAKMQNLAELEREPPEIEQYLWELVRARHDRPENDLLTVLTTSWDAGTLTDLELLGYIWGLVVGGYHNAGTNIANAFCLLDEFDLLDEARSHLDDERWLRRAGEEVLRFATPFPSGWRTAVTDVTLDSGQTIPAGSTVYLWFSAANRDVRVNAGNPGAAAPEVFDITRRPNRHLTFGAGVHHCQGAQLARLEAQVALQTVLTALPGLHMARDLPFERHAGMDDGISTVTFRFDQSAAERQLASLT